MDSLPCDPTLLNEPSRRLLAAFDRRPERALAELRMVRAEDGGWSLLVEIPSPLGDETRDVSLWVDERLVPSISFALWHTHADLLDDDAEGALELLLDYLAGIVAGTLVALDLGPGAYTLLDPSAPDALLDELTSRHAPDRFVLISWSGAADRTVDIATFSEDAAATDAAPPRNGARDASTSGLRHTVYRIADEGDSKDR